MSYNSLVPNSNPTVPQFEADSRKRKAEIYLYKSEIGTGSDEGIINHWFIAVKFENFWIVMEGVNNHGVLRGSYEKNKAERGGTQYRLKEVLGMPDLFDIITSPADLLNIVKNNDCNEKPYDVLKMNCQNWAKRAAEYLDSDSNSSSSDSN